MTFASCTLPVVTPAVWTRPLFASTPMCAFMPKYHWLPFFDCVISGSRLPSLFLVEGEAAISVASTIVPPRSSSPLAARCTATPSKIAFVSSWRSNRWRKLRIVVSSGIASRPSSRSQNARLDVVERLLGARIGQVIPLLQAVDAQHRRERKRPATALWSHLRIVRLDQSFELGPWHHRRHLAQEHVALRALLLRPELERCKAQLIGHPPAPSNQ